MRPVQVRQQNRNLRRDERPRGPAAALKLGGRVGHGEVLFERHVGVTRSTPTGFRKSQSAFTDPSADGPARARVRGVGAPALVSAKSAAAVRDGVQKLLHPSERRARREALENRNAHRRGGPQKHVRNMRRTGGVHQRRGCEHREKRHQRDLRNRVARRRGRHSGRRGAADAICAPRQHARRRPHASRPGADHARALQIHRHRGGEYSEPGNRRPGGPGRAGRAGLYARRVRRRHAERAVLVGTGA
mmetsp:Transcript_14085/g.46707  ORF Transcript_14085/g.46707 Transcript_14085/m.46707 type:complete len:246 (-) Transcript_14085:1109-1846(-)